MDPIPTLILTIIALTVDLENCLAGNNSMYSTHDFDNPLQQQQHEFENPSQQQKQAPKPPQIDINPLTYMHKDVEVNNEEIEAANMSIHNFFEGSGIDPKAQLAFDLVIILAKLNKFRIQNGFNISDET